MMIVGHAMHDKFPWKTDIKVLSYKQEKNDSDRQVNPCFQLSGFISIPVHVPGPLAT